MKLLKNRKQNRGFTLVEILLVVGFIALAGIAIYTIYAKVQVSQQSNTESRNLDTLRAGVKSMYGGNPNFATLTNTVVNQAKLTPDSMTDGNVLDIVNTFGGVVTITPLTIAPGTNNLFRITYPNVPSAVCSKLVTSAGSQFNQVTVNAVVVKAYGVNAPIDVAGTAAACAGADSVPILFDSL